MALAASAPRVLLVMPDQWPRALLRAALREAGYDAAGTRALGGTRHLAEADPDRGRVGLIVLGQEALTGADRQELDRLRRGTGAPILLLAPATRQVEAGPWTQVIRRPASIQDLVRAIERLLPLPPEARHPID
jgi:hypothetical protein